MNHEIPDTFEFEYPTVEDRSPMGYTTDPIGTQPADYETRSVTVRKAEAESVLEEIREAIRDRNDDGHFPTKLVLGADEYTTVDAYTRYVAERRNKPHLGGAESALDVDEVIVVPGSMIAPVVRPEVARDEHLSGESPSAGRTVSATLRRPDGPSWGVIQRIEWPVDEVARMTTPYLVGVITEAFADEIRPDGGYKLVLDDGRGEPYNIEWMPSPYMGDEDGDMLSQELRHHTRRLVDGWRTH